MEVLQDTYKDTKIGRIPEDWRVLKFREIFDFIITSSHSKNEMVYSETNTEIYNVHYGAIHTTYKEQILDFEKYNVPRITDDSKLPRENQFLIDGDLVIVDASEDWGGMGECVELKNLEGRKVIGGLHTYAVRDKINAFAKGFTGYIFQNTSVRNKLASYANVSKVYGITKGNISNVPIVIPTLPEQQKIAAILSTVDEQISTTDKIIEKSKELKKGLMQKLFSEGIGHTEFKDTKIGRIPKDWEVINLIDSTENGISNGVFNDPKKVGKGYKLVNVVNMYKGKSIQIKDLTLLDLNINEFEKNKVKYGDILFTRSSLVESGIAYSNINLSKDNDITYDGHLMKISPNKELTNVIFLSYFFRGNTSRKQFIARGKTTTMTTIGQKDIASVKIAIPPLPEQQKIAAILSEADAKIEKEQTQKVQLEALKKGLMQQLLTGKKRVKV